MGWSRAKLPEHLRARLGQPKDAVQVPGPAPAPHNKYHVSAASERTVDGRLFDSKLEMRIYQALRPLVDEKLLWLQPEFELQPAFEIGGRKRRPIVYTADFLLGSPRTDNTEPLLETQWVLDAKGMQTPVFKMKAKMFEYRYGRSIIQVASVKQAVTAVEKWKQSC